MWGRGRSGLKERSDRVVRERQEDRMLLDGSDVVPDALKHWDINDHPGVTGTPEVSGRCATPVHQAIRKASRIGSWLPS